MKHGTLQDFLEKYKVCMDYVVAEKQSGYILEEKYPDKQFYVYALIDPNNNQIFYIGKGVGGRVLKHEERTRRGVMQNKAKVAYLQKLFSQKQEAVKRILFFSDSEEMALACEESTIQDLKSYGLTNIIGGSVVKNRKANQMAEELREKVGSFREFFEGM